MNPFEMVVLIVAITAIASIFKAKYTRRHAAKGGDEPGVAGGDAALVADELRRLSERVAVLERIATDEDGPARLHREIEALRQSRLEESR